MHDLVPVIVDLLKASPYFKGVRNRYRMYYWDTQEGDLEVLIETYTTVPLLKFYTHSQTWRMVRFPSNAIITPLPAGPGSSR